MQKKIILGKNANLCNVLTAPAVVCDQNCTTVEKNQEEPKVQIGTLDQAAQTATIASQNLNEKVDNAANNAGNSSEAKFFVCFDLIQCQMIST